MKLSRPPGLGFFTLLSLVLVCGTALVSRTRSIEEADAGRRFESGGFTTEARVVPLRVPAGSRVSIDASVASNTSTSGIVDIEVFDLQHQRSYQRFFDNQQLPAGHPRSYIVTWDVPPAQPANLYRVKVGVFSLGWREIAHWNDDAATFAVVALRSSAKSQSATPMVIGANVPWFNWACYFGCGTRGGVNDRRFRMP